MGSSGRTKVTKDVMEDLASGNFHLGGEQEKEVQDLWDHHHLFGMRCKTVNHPLKYGLILDSAIMSAVICL